MQGYWSGLPCPPLGDLPNPGIKPAFLISPALLGVFFTTSAAWKAPTTHMGVARALFFCFWGKHDIEIESVDVLLGVFLVSPSQSHPSRMAIALTVLLGSVKTSSCPWSLAPESFGSVLDHRVGRGVMSCLGSSNSPENIWPLMLLSRRTGRRRERERKGGGMCIEKEKIDSDTEAFEGRKS